MDGPAQTARTEPAGRGELPWRTEVPLAVTVRVCRPEDLPVLEWHGRFAGHRAIMERTLAGQTQGTQLMLVADVGGYPVGQIWIDLERGRERGAGLLWALRVLPWLRGQGIGARLLRAAERALVARGRRWAELGVERSNPRARRLYERLGYERCGEIVETYELEGPGGPERHVADQVLMRRRLP